MHKVLSLKFDNHLVKHLPFQSQKVTPVPLIGSHLVTISQAMLAELGLTKDDINQTNFNDIVAGKVQAEGGAYHAQVYAGHQFGQFVSQLGDGRAISMGEIIGKNGQRWDLQLKGAGITPYSRMGDGRAVLRSSIREYLASEAMHALGIPTTRALSLVASDHDVHREQIEKGAVLTRAAQSFIRFGHFEYWFHHGKKSELNQLADYCLTEYFPACRETENPHLAMLESIVKNTAELVAKWQVYGFTHGVMNTDNMSILGLTIDYGPFAFLDDYQPGFVCNQSDHTGRYAFDQQPSIGLWNLNALAITYSDWLSTDEIRDALSQYELVFIKTYLELMQQKLGLSCWLETDQKLLGEWLAILQKQGVDYTNAFRLLNTVYLADEKNEQCQPLFALLVSHKAEDQQQLVNWLANYRLRLQQNDWDDEERIALQNQYNAKYILRNYLAQQAIERAEQGDYSELETLQNILANPFAEQPQWHKYASPSPEWGKTLEISCSS